MTLPIATGGRFCCCNDCWDYIDYFDCCLGSRPLCDNASEYFTDLAEIGCCFDQDDGLHTIPSQYLPNWRVLSGDWWKAESPDPQYDVFSSLDCNDGALWEVTGYGEILCRVGWANRGRMFYSDIPLVYEGIDVTFTLGCDEDGAGGYPVRIQCTAIVAGTMTIAVTTDDKSESFDMPLDRLTVKVCNNGIQGLIWVALNNVYRTALGVCGSLDTGPKFKIANNSGTPATFDNVAWGKQFVYDTQNQPECPTCGLCVCTKTDKDGNVIYRTWPNTWYGRFTTVCPDGSSQVVDFELSRDIANPCDPSSLSWSVHPEGYITVPGVTPGCNTQLSIILSCGGEDLSVTINDLGGAWSKAYTMASDDQCHIRYTGPSESWGLCGCIQSDPPTPGTAFFELSDEPL